MLQTRENSTVDQYSYKNKIYILCIIKHIRPMIPDQNNTNKV